jgi:hypothetical protein
VSTPSQAGILGDARVVAAPIGNALAANLTTADRLDARLPLKPQCKPTARIVT